MCSDAFKAEPVEEAPGIIKVQSRNMTEGGEEINTGGNASAEGGGEELERELPLQREPLLRKRREARKVDFLALAELEEP